MSSLGSVLYGEPEAKAVIGFAAPHANATSKKVCEAPLTASQALLEPSTELQEQESKISLLGLANGVRRAGSGLVAGAEVDFQSVRRRLKEKLAGKGLLPHPRSLAHLAHNFFAASNANFTLYYS